jgi:hypothetical protein
VLHKKGKKFPPQGGEITEKEFAEAVARALEIEFGTSAHAASTIMRWTGVSERSAKNWLAGCHGPSGSNLLLLARHCASVRQMIFRLMGMPSLALTGSLNAVRALLESMIREIDDLEHQ